MKNNGSRKPYIRPLSAGSWISRSKGVKPSRTVRAYEEQDCYVATFGIGMPGISELGRRKLRSRGHHRARSRRSV